MSAVDIANDRVDAARRRVEALEAQAAATYGAADAATPGGLHGDPATLSGVRRSGGHRSDGRRFAAYDRHAAVSRELAQARGSLAIAEAWAARCVADEAAPCDLDAIGKGDYVRTRNGWYRVVRVSAKSVTVETGYSWTERIARSKVVETRAAAPEGTQA